jgi:hypothetical protein
MIKSWQYKISVMLMWRSAKSLKINFWNESLHLPLEKFNDEEEGLKQ